MQKFGIDISEWQGGFNFDKAVKEGVKFAILRGAYSLSKDDCFESFYKSCKARNIPVGVYHYSMAKNVEGAKKEAAFMLKILNGKQLEYPIYLDVEDKTQQVLGKDLLTKIIDTYCDTLEKAGYYVGIYSTYNYLKNYAHIDKLDRYDKWIAQWYTSCECPKPYGVWQYGGETNYIRSNKVAGMVCDQDYAYQDYPTVIKNAGLNGFGSTPTPSKKTLDELANEVIYGKWGTGAERKKLLTEAGYDYDAVQNRVNETLFKKSVDEIAREVIAGKWGNGAKRKKELTAAGYDYSAVQKRVNELM